MIFNEDVLFLHVPKTGGMSLSRLLVDVLPPPVVYTLPSPDVGITNPGVVQLRGLRHESLPQAQAILRDHGRELESFRLIMGVVRNPYAMEVSRYSYLQLARPWDAGHNQDLALTEDFETFTLQSVDHAGVRIEEYFTLSGQQPQAMKILRQESLSADVSAALRNIGLDTVVELPRNNRSRHDPYQSYYTPASERAVYERYRWVFDQGHYSRMTREEMGAPDVIGWHIPIAGAVRQVGRSTGLYADGWVGEELSFSVKPDRQVGCLRIHGRGSRRGERLSLGVADQIDRASFTTLPDQSFAWNVPTGLVPNTLATISVTASQTWSPQDYNAVDGRHLSFALERIDFIS